MVISKAALLIHVHVVELLPEVLVRHKVGVLIFLEGALLPGDAVLEDLLLCGLGERGRNLPVTLSQAVLVQVTCIRAADEAGLLGLGAGRVEVVAAVVVAVEADL